MWIGASQSEIAVRQDLVTRRECRHRRRSGRSQGQAAPIAAAGNGDPVSAALSVALSSRLRSCRLAGIAIRSALRDLDVEHLGERKKGRPAPKIA
jgi:hypothetical protein